MLRGAVNSALGARIIEEKRLDIGDTITAMEENMRLIDRITTDPEICHGKPVIRGLRYPVEVILELLSSGMTTEEILADYEDLEPDDILAVLTYATRLSQIKRIEPVLA